MNSFDLDFVDEKSRAGSEFMFRIAQELQRVFLAEKKSRKLTQQAIARELNTSRAVINRQLQGLENIGSRRIGELFWAMGWEPYFEARRIPDHLNDLIKSAPPAPRAAESDNRQPDVGALSDKKEDKKASAAEVAYAQ
jgi:transcriptional regulator with XRE-family HTH domain